MEELNVLHTCLLGTLSLGFMAVTVTKHVDFQLHLPLDRPFVGCTQAFTVTSGIWKLRSYTQLKATLWKLLSFGREQLLFA